MKDEERCDKEKEVFNARIDENEMVITIAEYRLLTNQLENFKNTEKTKQDTLKRQLNENLQLKLNLQEVKEENEALKKGIINFVKVFGG